MVTPRAIFHALTQKSALTSVSSSSMRAFSPLDHTRLSSTPPETAAFLVHRHGIREIAAMILALHQVFSLPSFKENEGPGGGTNAEKHGRLPDNTTLTNSVDELVDPDDPNGPTRHPRSTTGLHFSPGLRVYARIRTRENDSVPP